MKRIIISGLLLSFLAAETRIISHSLILHIDPQEHLLEARDSLRVIYTNGLEFKLGQAFTISSLTVDGKPGKFNLVSGTAASQGELNTYRIPRWLKRSGDVIIEIAYSGTKVQDTGASSFSREKVAMEITGTISEEGIFLAPSSGYYPLADESLVEFESEIHLPAGWEAVSEGDRLEPELTGDGQVLRYRTAHPVDGVHVTAAQWDVRQRTVDGVDFYTFFFPEDSALAEQYLEMSIGYVAMYNQLLSPYPFSKFAVVENFFPTGYGMPSYTVLGRSVVRLPFIVYTSLGHEVLHNWWGNSVYIGEGGNWCEGLTTYQADYRYKLQQGEAAARQYRKDILKDYTVYTAAEGDFPPAKFTQRSDMSTRAVGYGKVAMIFHMLEQQVGEETFQAALRLVIERKQWDRAGWDDFFQALTETSGENLKAFQAAWIRKAGAPLLELEAADTCFYLRQQGSIKPLWAPVRITRPGGDVEEITVHLTGAELSLPYKPGSDVVELAVDPDYHLMRRLDESELDATIRNILNEKEFVFIAPDTVGQWLELATAFQAALSGEGDPTVILAGQPVGDQAAIYLGTLPESGGPQQRKAKLLIGGEAVATGDNGVVWAFKQANGRPGLVLFSTAIDQLTPLARKIPHYGKYGYLVFNSGQNVIKGNHKAPASNLTWRRDR